MERCVNKSIITNRSEYLFLLYESAVGPGTCREEERLVRDMSVLERIGGEITWSSKKERYIQATNISRSVPFSTSMEACALRGERCTDSDSWSPNGGAPHKRHGKATPPHAALPGLFPPGVHLELDFSTLIQEPHIDG